VATVSSLTLADVGVDERASIYRLDFLLTEIPNRNSNMEEMMSSNLYDAHRQWCIRLPDERFHNLDSLHAFTQRLKDASEEKVRKLPEVHLDVTGQSGLALNGSEEPAILTNWSFSQLCTIAGAPAKYLRTLPPETVIECLRHSLSQRETQVKLLFRNSSEDRVVSAFTGPKYGRIWDADVVASLKDAVEGTGWRVPLAQSNGSSDNAGLYASDRDMFAFFVNDENPIEVGDAKLGRGFFCWNSETGSCTFGLTTFLYNYVCGNHIVWGAEQVQELKIVHRSRAIDRFRTEALPALDRFVENRVTTEAITRGVDQAARLKVGDDLGKVTEWFKEKPFTGSEIIAGWRTGRNEGDDVSTLWGMVQGLTAFARQLPHTDVRVNLERRAGTLLKSAN